MDSHLLDWYSDEVAGRLERLRVKQRRKHGALRARLYFKAIR